MKVFQSLARTPIEELIPLAMAAEEYGFDGVTLSDHLVRPLDVASRYPYSADGRMAAPPETSYPDVWVAAGAIAQATRRLMILTAVYVVPLRDPISVAKALSTAAVMSGGRMMFGVGLGWMREEFSLTGQSFANRGERTDEMLALINALMSPDFREHRGRHYDVPPLRMAPLPADRPPVIVGGHSGAALARAARHDGWLGVNYPLAEVPRILGELAMARANAPPRETPFEIALAIDEPLTPDALAQLASLGVTLAIHPPAPIPATQPDLAARCGHLAQFARLHGRG